MSYLIVFEGPDGSGKSSLAEMLYNELRGLNRDAYFLREPPKNEFSARIYERLAENKRHAPEVEAALFMAARVRFVRKTLQPLVRQREPIIILDRSYLSTAAYQGAVGMDWKELLADAESFYPRPSIVFFCTCELDTAMARVGSRGTSDEFEKREYQKRVHSIYHELVHELQDISRVLNTEHDPIEQSYSMVKKQLGFANAHLRLVFNPAPPATAADKPCTHPAREGQHEWYVDGDGSVCAACGAREKKKKTLDTVGD